MPDLEDYWNSRFQKEGMIWGSEPSSTVYRAAEWFQRNCLQTVLVLGAGYGRNSKVLSATGFQVDGVELSEAAVQLGRQWDPDTQFVVGSVLDEGLLEGRSYDAIYAYDLIHLFLMEDRRRLIDLSLSRLRPGGIFFATCFSDQDSHFGIGRCMEEGTFEYQVGKYAHFFTEEDLLDHFRELVPLEIGSVDERLQYLDMSTKEYRLRYLVARKGE